MPLNVCHERRREAKKKQPTADLIAHTVKRCFTCPKTDKTFVDVGEGDEEEEKSSQSLGESLRKKKKESICAKHSTANLRSLVAQLQSPLFVDIPLFRYSHPATLRHSDTHTRGKLLELFVLFLFAFSLHRTAEALLNRLLGRLGRAPGKLAKYKNQFFCSVFFCYFSFSATLLRIRTPVGAKQHSEHAIA